MSSLLFIPLKVFLISLDFLIMVVTLGWIPALRKALSPPPMRSEPVDPSDQSHRVRTGYKNKLATTPDPSIQSVYDLMTKSFSTYADSTAFNKREYLGQLTPKIKKFGKTISTTYASADTISHKFGAALRGIGMVPSPPKGSLEKLKTPCALAIFENTCQEWILSAMGCFSQSMIVTTIYATLGMDAVIEAVNEGIIRAMVCNFSSVEALVKRAKEMPSLKTIIYTSDLMAPDADFKPPASTSSLEIISFEDFVARGDTTQYPPTKPTMSSTAVIMYTSGSTGKPKGVVITHSNVLAAIAATIEPFGFEVGKEAYLAYLPMAHIMEFFVEFCVIYLGSSLNFADPKTLTTTGASPVGALEVYRPTMMVGVPKIYDSIKKGVELKISKSPAVAQFLVKTAFEARKWALSMGWDTPLFKALVFKKFAAVFGGRMIRAASGGGPLNAEVQIFMHTMFGFDMLQGYGLTETTASVTAQSLDDKRTGIAGALAAGNEVKLESTPSITDRGGLPYLNTDTTDNEGNKVFGRGEILVKGNTISLGYYCQPEKTREEFQEDGWFHTGDIGQFMDDGSIKIVDRKKNLVKLKGGEYIAVENMEMAYGNSDFVDAVNGGILCYGDGDMDRPVAMMQLNENGVKKWIAAKEIPDDYEKVVKSKQLNDAVLADLKNEGKKGGLSRLEGLAGVVFLNTPWTPENGCLTAANKLNRKFVVQKFEKEFEEVKKKGIF